MSLGLGDEVRSLPIASSPTRSRTDGGDMVAWGA